MLETLRIQNFKSWQDTGTIEFGALTGFFGTNSSGKTSILQFLLMLKQTVESSDRARILHFGDERSYVELGTMADIIYNHNDPGQIVFELSYDNEGDYTEALFGDEEFSLISGHSHFGAKIIYEADNIKLKEVRYHRQGRTVALISQDDIRFTFHSTGFSDSDETNGVTMFNPHKFYGFPSNLAYEFRDWDALQIWERDLESLFLSTFYLGPLRDYPRRFYSWSGEKTSGVGNRGERAIAALLASRLQGPTITIADDQPKRTLEEHIAYWLTELDLIHSFVVKPIAPNRKEYEVRIRKTASAPEVLITDVGFGVSQLLPVLVLLFYVPEGSTIILEQPEIHLHPAVQAGLADVILDAIKRRKVQVILESHSEHLLQRLQRRMAENEMISADQVKLYFTKFEKAASEIEELKLDEYGNILNWPANFFGNPFAEASAMMDAELDRKEQASKS